MCHRPFHFRVSARAAEGGEQEVSSDAIKQGGALTSRPRRCFHFPESRRCSNYRTKEVLSARRKEVLTSLQHPCYIGMAPTKLTGSAAQWDNEAAVVKRDLDLSTYTPSPLSRPPAPSVQVPSRLWKLNHQRSHLTSHLTTCTSLEV